MRSNNLHNTGIPISLSLDPTLAIENVQPKKSFNKRRLLFISISAIVIAIGVSIIAKLLVHLIDLITNISFYGNFSFAPITPAENNLGLFVITIPVIGGLIIGLMAYYGSKAIRGHGIPEAMEQILTNKSKIKPTITYLKPISAAISIGTGGPFGAEGPIIASGGALGSTIGQIMKISNNERKILLAAGATAGMSAIFGSPIAGIFLAIELLLFEFSPRSIIPVSLACITGAAGHHFLFGPGVVFPIIDTIEPASNSAIAWYSALGIVVGLLSVLVTKIVYFIEDSFEKLPVHWAWWPMIGGIAVGIVGYFSPRTLGVGYNNIADILSGSVSMQLLLSLCILKFISWSVSLGSGTSGGTLAPLLTIGGAAGAIFGHVINDYFPQSGIYIPLAALVGMAAMFAGASRAFITSIIFALETTGQSNALLPLLASCTGAYFLSYFIMDNTIMTEKIARRGINTPNSYEPDILEKLTVEQILTDNGIIISEENKIKEVREWLDLEPDYKLNYFIISSNQGEYRGILSASNLYSNIHTPENLVGSLIKRNKIYISLNDSLKTAVETMAKENIDVLPVVSNDDGTIIGILSYRDIIDTYKYSLEEHEKKNPAISLKRKGLKIMLRGKQMVSAFNRMGK
ncbi:MAG: chloride channel protein [Chitinophagaceae bacterium]|jgi:H+/Cl- antiporter ClcA|nr:chloride channel protein [Chitinophagaceae bacterium]MBP6987073.1 chloride channel protein [Ferruginibacter sp.]MBK7345541.1 chloride channel protein [Chitinophagaceae bacterium]MBK7734967.1 chloride channel protein [Chitinophagaceae bacterium]MBP7718488.1 chloride channel protein [Ferruginibacter sp.]